MQANSTDTVVRAAPPMPPPELRLKVAGADNEAHFDASGPMSVADFDRALAGVGRSRADFSRILEWGCGCGRILRHLDFDPRRQEVHGCDIDRGMIDWLQGAMPELRLVTSGGLPPLPYADGQFDLIVNHSVLTHLDEAYQDAWLGELRRILAVEGVLILTVSGVHAFEFWAASLPQGDPVAENTIHAARKTLAEQGIYFRADDGWADQFPKYYQNTFHAPWYVFEHWSRYFDIASFMPRGSLGYQDMVVLKHKTPAPPPRPGKALSMPARFAWRIGRR